MNLSRLRIPSLLVTLAALTVSVNAGAPELATVTNPAPALPAGVYESDQVDVAPHARSQPRPVYPSELKRYSIEGEVNLLITVDPDGHVKDPVVLKATDGRFGKAAADAVLKWRFKPAQLNGNKVPCRVRIPVVFELSG